ncbi:MAG: hypothetical protein GY856_25200, partial [bacterium]|nr:hypothetical protein [bacterium]
RDAVMTGTALVALIAAAFNLLKEIRGELNSYAVLGYGLLAFVAVYVLAWLARRWFAPPSTFRKPSALDIGRKYLRGRDTDLDNLLNRLKDFPLVWLVGESGAGKSLLLVLGLVPRLKEEWSFFPVYLEHWGADWERGPREGLCRTLNETLDDPARKKLGLNGPVTVNQLVPVLGRIRKKLARTPILIFDQFDDYQTRHREPRRSWHQQAIRVRMRRQVRRSPMTAHSITLQLPVSLYHRYKQRAEQTHRTLEAELLEAVTIAAPEAEHLPRVLAEAVSGLEALDEDALLGAARGTFPPEAGARLEALHIKRQAEGLTEEEEEATERLVRQYERAMLVRAHALKLLKERGHDVSELLAAP